MATKKMAATPKKGRKIQSPMVIEVEYKGWGPYTNRLYFTGWMYDEWAGKQPMLVSRWYEAKEYTMESAARKAADFIRKCGIDSANGWKEFKVSVKKAWLK